MKYKMNYNVFESTANYVLSEDSFYPINPPVSVNDHILQYKLKLENDLLVSIQKDQKIEKELQKIEELQNAENLVIQLRLEVFNISVDDTNIKNIGPPPGLPLIPIENKKIKLEHTLSIEKQKINYIESCIKEINELLVVQSMPIIKPIPIKPVVVEDSNKPTSEFITAVYNLLSKEAPIQLSNIPHKLPSDVLPTKRQKGLFTKWMEQVPNIHIDIISNTDSKGIKKDVRIYSLKNVKVCFQKGRGKPCKKLNDKGLCKYCN